MRRGAAACLLTRSVGESAILNPRIFLFLSLSIQRRATRIGRARSDAEPRGADIDQLWVLGPFRRVEYG